MVCAQYTPQIASAQNGGIDTECPRRVRACLCNPAMGIEREEKAMRLNAARNVDRLPVAYIKGLRDRISYRRHSRPIRDTQSHACIDSNVATAEATAAFVSLAGSAFTTSPNCFHICPVRFP